MNEAEFLEKYEEDIPFISAWGDFVNAAIQRSLDEKLIGNPIKDVFLRIPPTPRLKSKDSILAKAFWRDKNYSDPYNEITDKVGVRYVVLLVEHISIVSEVIKLEQQWEYELDRDFEKEKVNSPLIFDYQSIHFVLKNRRVINYNGIDIPEGVPCEVQIRTLLQHACSELTHDTIFKKDHNYPPIVFRSIAKSRALTESTDDIFSNIATILAKESDEMNRLLNDLNSLYKEIRPPEFEEKSNVFILNAVSNLLKDISINDVRKFILDEQPAVRQVIQSKANALFIYRQPIVLLLYYLIQKKRESFKNVWPLPLSEIQPLFTDLGIALTG